MKICSVDGCDRKASRVTGICTMHNKRLTRHGSTDSLRRSFGIGTVKDGYIIKTLDGKQKREHIIVAEKALGKILPTNAIVHHSDGNRTNNVNSNLVICPDRAYHNLLHARINAWDATGDPNKRSCKFCQSYDDLINMTKITHGKTHYFYHKQCQAKESARRLKERNINNANI